MSSVPKYLNQTVAAMTVCFPFISTKHTKSLPKCVAILTGKITISYIYIYIYIYMLLFHYIARTVYLIPENLYSRNTTVQFIFQETRMIFFMISQATQHNICLLHERYMNTCRKCYQWKSVVRIYLLLPFFSCYSDFILILDKWRQLNNRQKHNFIKIII